MKKITFMTDDNSIVSSILAKVANSKKCYSMNIENMQEDIEDEAMDLVDGFCILMPVLDKVNNRHLLRDAIAKHIAECADSEQTNTNHCFSAKTASYWFFPYAALKMTGMARCSIGAFIDQMAKWFPLLIDDVRETKKHVKKLEAKFADANVVDWSTSPRVKYKKRRQARSITYDGLFCTLNGLKKKLAKQS